jgi:hypothetical protein
MLISLTSAFLIARRTMQKTRSNSTSDEKATIITEKATADAQIHSRQIQRTMHYA